VHVVHAVRLLQPQVEAPGLRAGLRVAGARGLAVAVGESVIKYPSPLNVPKYTYDRSCCWARSDEHQRVMADPPAAIAAWQPALQRFPRLSPVIPRLSPGYPRATASWSPLCVGTPATATWWFVLSASFSSFQIFRKSKEIYLRGDTIESKRIHVSQRPPPPLLSATIGDWVVITEAFPPGLNYFAGRGRARERDRGVVGVLQLDGQPRVLRRARVDLGLCPIVTSAAQLNHSMPGLLSSSAAAFRAAFGDASPGWRW
jgi:hypothetical protein